MSIITPAEYFDPNTDLGRRRIADIPKKFARIRATLQNEPADLQWLEEELERFCWDLSLMIKKLKEMAGV